MHNPYVLPFVVLLLQLVGCKGLLSVKNGSPSRIILLSFDGFRWDYLYRLKQLKTNSSFWYFIDSLGALYNQNGMKPAFVTATFPNHYTIATGLFEESHGIIANVIYDKLLNKTFDLAKNSSSSEFFYGGEPLWRTVKNQLGAQRVACYMWAACNYENLTYYIPYTRKINWKNVVNNTLYWLKKDVQLITIYNKEPDYSGHRFGTEGFEMNRTLVEIDDQLDYLLTTLMNSGFLTFPPEENDVHLIIVSDHGMLDMREEIYIPVNDTLFSVTTYSYTFLHVEPKQGKLSETLRYLKAFPQLDVYKKSDIPDKWRYKNNDRIGSIFAVAKPYFSLNIKSNATQGKFNQTFGGHGYDNDVQEMRGIFLAGGPSFAKPPPLAHERPLLNVANTDIYLLICTILGLVPAPNNGSLSTVLTLLKATTSSNKWLSVLVQVIVIASTISLVIIICTAFLWREFRHKNAGAYRFKDFKQYSPIDPLLATDTDTPDRSRTESL